MYQSIHRSIEASHIRYMIPLDYIAYIIALEIFNNIKPDCVKQNSQLLTKIAPIHATDTIDQAMVGWLHMQIKDKQTRPKITKEYIFDFCQKIL